MIIQNALIYTPEHIFTRGSLTIRNGRIVSGSGHLPGEEIINAEGLYAIPGLVDIHFHGAMGHDFCDADNDGLAEIAGYEASHGILAICPATMTYPEDKLSEIARSASEYKSTTGADLVGINMEGPFVSLSRLGAQNPKYVMSGDAAMFRRINALSGGLVKLIDIAPEEPGNLEMIKEICGEVRVSIAHTCCDYDTALAAFDAGARQATHLFNAMPDINHRSPGPVIAALESNADAELIADGVHVHPAMVRFTFRSFGADRVILISDSMMATGLGDGSSMLGGQAVTVTGNRAVLTDHPETVAGSVTNLYDCMCSAVRMGVPLTDAVRAASENPAKAIGILSDYGSLSAGSYGNVILTDQDLNIVKVIQKGIILQP